MADLAYREVYTMNQVQARKSSLETRIYTTSSQNRCLRYSDALRGIPGKQCFGANGLLRSTVICHRVGNVSTLTKRVSEHKTSAARNF